MTRWKRLEVVLEFFIFGVVFGVVEDFIAIKIITGATIGLREVGIIVAVALPFAILGELVVDRVNFARIFRKLSRKGNV